MSQLQKASLVGAPLPPLRQPGYLDLRGNQASGVREDKSKRRGGRMSWHHFRDETPIGRRDYHCWLCGGTIPVGEEHRVRSGVEDGEVHTFRGHSECFEEYDSWDPMEQESFLSGEMPVPEAVAERRAS